MKTKPQNNDLGGLVPFFELNIWEMSGVFIRLQSDPKF